MNKTGFTIFSCVVLALLNSSCAFNGNEYHVAPTGDDINIGTEEAPFQTISAAARIAQAGDTVTVHEGVYREYARLLVQNIRVVRSASNIGKAPMDMLQAELPRPEGCIEIGL